MSLSDEAVIAAVAEKIQTGNCILFLGAGVHYPPPEGSQYNYPQEERPPLGRAFSEHLAERCGFAEQFPRESTGSLQRVSLYYETLKGRRDLVDEVRGAVLTGKKPSPVVRGLAELPFSMVVTTNYDQLFEDALRSAGKRPVVSIYDKNSDEPSADYPGTPGPQSPFLFKIHGDVETPESIVITDEDYIDFILRMSERGATVDPIPLTFRFFFTKHPTLFVGYSLLDYNLRLLFKTLRWKIDQANIPNTYSVDLYPDPLIHDVWHNRRRYVQFIVQDVWTFVPALYRMIMGKEMPQ